MLKTGFILDAQIYECETYKFQGITMSWLYLFLAGAFEIVFAVALKHSEGFSKPLPALLSSLALIISFALLNMSLSKLPVGTAYAVWTGIGALGTAIYGIFVFGESAAPARLLCLGFILIGIVGLNMVSNHS